VLHFRHLTHTRLSHAQGQILQGTDHWLAAEEAVKAQHYPQLRYSVSSLQSSLVKIYIALCRSFAQNAFRPFPTGSEKSQIRVLRGDGGIGPAPRLAAAHRAADTNAPGGHLNYTPGEGACLSHVADCAVLGPPGPSKVPHNLRVPVKRPC